MPRRPLPGSRSSFSLVAYGAERSFRLLVATALHCRRYRLRFGSGLAFFGPPPQHSQPLSDAYVRPERRCRLEIR